MKMKKIDGKLYRVEEPADATQVIRKQIIDLLTEDLYEHNSNEVILALLPIVETHRKTYYLPNDESGLEYALEYNFSNNLVAFRDWITGCHYNSEHSFLEVGFGEVIISESDTGVYFDLYGYIQKCSNEVLDEMIAVLDELQLW